MAFKEIPDRYLGTIIHFLMNFHNDTSEFSRPHIRKSFESSYIFFIFLYGALMLSGIIANLFLIRKIVCSRQHRFIVNKYLACNALNDVLKCMVVLPIALCTTLFQNWFYGSFLCDFFPMLQDVPFHATMLTFLLIAFDRYRQILYPIKPRFPFSVCLIGVWISSIFAVLPYAVYTRYVDLEAYLGEQFKNTGICAINIEDNIEEYVKGLFIIMYVMPLALIAFLHVKASEEIKNRQMVTLHGVNNGNRKESNSLTSVNPPGTLSNSPKGPASVVLSVSTELLSNPCSSRSRQDSSIQLAISGDGQDDPKDWIREQRIQKFISNVTIIYAACLLPLNLVRLLKHVIYETYENSFHFDVTFVIVVLIAFIPSLATPLLYIFYQFRNVGNNQTSNHYFRFGRTSDVSLCVYDSFKRHSSRTRKKENRESGPLSTPKPQ